MACEYAEVSGMGLVLCVYLFIYVVFLATKVRNRALKNLCKYGIVNFLFCWGAQIKKGGCLGQLHSSMRTPQAIMSTPMSSGRSSSHKSTSFKLQWPWSD